MYGKPYAQADRLISNRFCVTWIRRVHIPDENVSDHFRLIPGTLLPLRMGTLLLTFSFKDLACFIQ
jgi:hypothetical protein